MDYTFSIRFASGNCTGQSLNIIFYFLYSAQATAVFLEITYSYHNGK